ncbi:MAG: hypothetical protein AVDCRST_MAG68-4657 [uncultured Gemmatimonadetes bacterium]|uniref:DUF1802 family protein n=1 Tax=uncultured Gemmatimonadota bacterium TaxID=203437 RepID=A0A6J4MM73_9BACT|nr:MAG: hypothetical protein AVDCRST_MAG68-4657 [uncultured Gemmatimonadota bacterium]
MASREALKEWASVERALAAGRVSLLVRKGGISERRGGFDVEHRAFWIFPTAFHQNADELAPGFRDLIGGAEPASRDEVRLRVFAEVVEAFKIESLEVMDRLAGLHPMAPETVKARFEYKNRPYLHVVLVRARTLPEPIVIPNTIGYEGCVSWVTLDDEIPTAGAVPAVGDAEFEAVRREVLARIGA